MSAQTNDATDQTAATPSFTCYPALDIRGGEVVRLRQGDYDRQTTYALDPVEQATTYAEAGARWLHLVDLDAALVGGWTLAELVRRIVDATGLRVQVGGGVRSVQDVDAMLAAGAERAVVGSLAVNRPEMVAGWLRQFGPEHVTVALDARHVEDHHGGRWELPTSGWTETSGVDMGGLLEGYRAEGLRHVLATDISKDGMMEGPGLGLYDHLRALDAEVDVQASGGVRDARDVEAVREQGCAGVVLGRSLLDGALDLSDALALERGGEAGA
ncbi:1-(5-phosphoribosyl)-5-[(5-phosphoribosylamino)methylideneamino]imidazole-4-carboxamide isomerase [Kytococcus sedentarius]|uniref:1-(5-phosphoribosyl)-5-[(5- phosphoribosylamino)methylideneamino]imidazole-4- carboxamide isomerase n=1 Tax=Kytococcus sedentarius TaxID=1276 RepID=UPI0035BC08C2